MSAVPLHEAVRYVAAAYAVVFVLVLLYVAVIGRRLGHVEHEIETMERLLDRAGPPA
jgi:CcmD family protein